MQTQHQSQTATEFTIYEIVIPCEVNQVVTAPDIHSGMDAPPRVGGVIFTTLSANCRRSSYLARQSECG